MEERALSSLVERTADSLTASFELNDTEYRASLSSAIEFGPEADSLLALGLLPAMSAGRPLVLPETVSPELLSAVPEIQGIYHVWDPDRFRRVAVTAEARVESPRSPASGVGCFFSGGVDSFYTLLKRHTEITHLIFAHGFDILLEEVTRRQRALDSVRAVADELGKTLIEVHTNLAPLAHETGVGWKLYHGAALAAVALLFQDRLGKVLIPATYTYANLLPWGSHPLLDPLWSTEQTKVEHDGCETTRVEKAAYISEHPVAMKHLRVCLARETDFNCGRCEKCLRTIVNLRAAGVSGRCWTLPEKPDLEAIAGMDLGGEEVLRVRVLENLRALEKLGTEPEIERALETALERNFEGEGIRRQLEITRSELEKTRGMLARLSTNNRRLRARSEELGLKNESLARENPLLRNQGSGDRYRVADLLAGACARLPGIKRLLGRRKGKDALADEPTGRPR